MLLLVGLQALCLREGKGNVVVRIGEAYRRVSFEGLSEEEVVSLAVGEGEWCLSMTVTLYRVEGIRRRIAMLLESFWRRKELVRKNLILVEMTGLGHILE
jgi:hypothetical protein